MAPSAVSLLLAENLGASAGGYGTTSFATTPGRLVIGAVFCKVASPNVPDTSFCSHASIIGDFVQVGPSIGFASLAAPLVRGTIWKGVSNSATSATAFVGFPTASTDCCHTFFEITGALTSRGDLGVAQGSVASAVDAGTALATATLSGFTAGGITIAVWYSTTASTITPEAGWTGLTPASGAGSTIRAAYILSGDTTPTATASVAGPNAGLALEITDTAQVAAPTPQLIRTSRLVN